MSIPTVAKRSASVLLLTLLGALALSPAASAVLAEASEHYPTPRSIDNGTFTAPLEISASGAVRDVNLTVDMDKVDGTCTAPGSGSTFWLEVSIALESPSGTSVLLMPVVSINSHDSTGRLQLTFDDEASEELPATGAPTTGTYRPVNALSAFDGQQAGGTWQVSVGDLSPGDPTCLYGLTLDVDIDQTPILDGGALADAQVGNAYAASIPTNELSGVPGNFSLGSTSLPPGLTMGPYDGYISGTPTTPGKYDFTVTASNSDGSSGATPFSITVNERPFVLAHSDFFATVGEPFSIAPADIDGYPAPTFSIHAGTLPTGLTLNSSTGEISGTPMAEAKTYNVEIAASNGIGSPYVYPIQATVRHGAVSSLSMDPPTSTVDQLSAATFTLSAYDVASNAVVLADGDVVLTSDYASDVIAGFTVTFMQPGTHTITATHTATDIATSSTVNVTPLEAAGLTGPATFDAVAGEPLTYTPTLDPGYPANATVSLAGGTLPDGVTLNASTGELTGTSVVAGDYAFTLEASNGVGAPALLPVTITVAANEPTVLTVSPAADTVDQDSTVTFTVTATDDYGNPVALADGDVVLTSDNPADAVAGMAVTFGSGGTRTITAQHAVTLADATADISVTPWAPPVLAGDAAVTVTAGAELAYRPALTAGYPATTSVTVVDGALPDGVTLDAATGALTGVVRQAGDYAVVLEADNGKAAPAQLAVTITVEPALVSVLKIAPSAMSVNQGGSLTVSASGTDEFGNPVVLAPGDLVLTSSVPTDVVKGNTVTFPHASPHTLTVTHMPTGTSASVTVEVVPTAEPVPTATPGPTLAATGADNVTGIATGAAFLVLAGLGLLAVRRRWVA